jgi:glycosyltransferase involved in cell wall biosynthesis
LFGVRPQRRAAFKRAPAQSRDAVRILIVTDAWTPQINGVVRTLQAIGRELTGLGHAVRFATPENHTTVPLPTYPEIRLAMFPRSRLARAIDEFEPNAIHIATEGTMGLAARAICLERGLPFTTSFHTRFPDYVHARFPFIPESAVFRALRMFHAPAAATMVSTASLREELEHHGFRHVVLWSRGVDVDLFSPGDPHAYSKLGLELAPPVFLYVGRVAIEKGLPAFLSLRLPGSKVVIGDGPARAELESRFPDAHFLGRKLGSELASLYAASDVFVFPSRTDTFGLVLLEALACGLPVAAYAVQATLSLLGGAPVAALHDDLGVACLKALTISRKSCRDFAFERSWRSSAEQFLANLAIGSGAEARSGHCRGEIAPI